MVKLESIDLKDSLELTPFKDDDSIEGEEEDLELGKNFNEIEISRGRMWKVCHPYIAWIICVILIIFIMSEKFDGRTSLMKLTGIPLNICRDPYSEEGYIYRGSSANSIRWIPYEKTHLPNQTSIPDNFEPAESAFDLSTPNYNEYLNSDRDKVEWLRNKTILFVGDSHDRSNVASFCSQHPGSVHKVPGFHLSSSCVLPSLNFVLKSWFHYGLAEEKEDWYMRSEIGPYSIEERLKMFLKLESTEPIPDLIILNSFYWDLRYFGLHSDHYKTSLGNQEERKLSLGELQWHQFRSVTFVKIFREAFPGVKIMFRLGQAHSTNRNSGNIAVYQLNQSIRSIMKKLVVPVLEWSKLLAGETESNYLDDQHLREGAPAWLLGNMMLYYLKQAIDGC